MLGMNYWTDKWDLHEDICPCDVHVNDWIADQGLKKKVIFHFGTGTQHLLATMTGDVIGIDWRSSVDDVLETGRGVQGNLDPTLLLGPFARVEEKTQEILILAGGRPGHIFNLGHGVLPDTDPADLQRLVELVHERTATVAA